jgi:peptidyl-prolyl cis-trans isomerase C
MSLFSNASWLRLSAAAAVVLLASACNKGQPGSGTAPSAASAAGTPDAGAAVATVNGNGISRATFDEYVKALTQGKNIPELTSEQKGQVLDQLVTMQLLAAAAKKDGLEKDADVVARENLSDMRILSDAAVAKYAKAHEPTDEEVKSQYATVVASGEATEYHARHILVDSEAKATALLKKIRGGAKFEDVAKAESSDPSKNNGGDLGWFSLNNMVPEFAQAVKKLKKDEISEPVKTQYGWHIIKLEDTRDPSLDTLKARLTAQLTQKKVIAYVEEMKKSAQIDKKL